MPGPIETREAPHLSGLAPAVASTWACAAACSLLSSVVVMVRPPRYSFFSRSRGVDAVRRVVEDQVGDVVAEVRRHLSRRAPLLCGRDLELDTAGDGGVMISLEDFPLAEHFVQDLVAPLDGVFRMDGGIVEAGAVDQPGEQGSLRQGEVFGGGAEEVPGCGLDTVRIPVEEHDIEVALEDLVLGVLLFQFDGELHLAHLVADALLPAEDDLIGSVRGQQGLVDHVRHVLLGQRRCALPAAAGQVGCERPENPLRVDAGVLVEAAVLDGDNRVPDVGRHLVQPDLHAVLREEGGDQLPVRAQHFG